MLNFYRAHGSLWDIEENLPGVTFARARDLARREGQAFWPTLWKMEAAEAVEAAKPRNGNVFAGPWDADQGARP